MELLEKDGLISKKRGLGVNVRKDLTTPAHDQIMTGESYKIFVRAFTFQMLSEEWVEATYRIKNMFDNQADAFKNGQVYQLVFLMTHKEDNRRKNYVTCYIPAWIMDRMSQEDVKASIDEGLLQLNGLTTDRITLLTRPWICNAQIGEKIGMQEDNALFRRFYTYYATDNRILACFESIGSSVILTRDIKFQW